MPYVHIPLTELRVKVIHNQGCTNVNTWAELTEAMHMTGKPKPVSRGIYEETVATRNNLGTIHSGHESWNGKGEVVHVLNSAPRREGWGRRTYCSIPDEVVGFFN
jgi:hypothetical protein